MQHFLKMEKVNYQIKLDSIIKRIKDEGYRPTLVLHSCCGPCSSYCLSSLAEYFDITVLYYNPNIFPEEEYDLRLSEQKRLINEMNREYGSDIKLCTFPYDHSEFLEYVKGLENEPEGGARCAKCFELRLKKTKELALKQRADYFGTTLTVSPHKNAVLINAIGEELAGLGQKENLLWLPSDFKKKEGYKKSIELSKKYDLYRQNFCGCEFAK